VDNVFCLTHFVQASPDGHLLGYILSDQIYNDCDEEVGFINRGTGTLHDALGSTIMDVDGIGCARGHTGVVLGQFEGLGYRELSQMSLYVLFLDYDFRDESTDDLECAPTQEEHQPPQETKLPDPVRVEQKVKAKRTDFVRPKHMLESGSGDKVTLELLKSDDVATLDFQSRMVSSAVVVLHCCLV
jgi:hypothetical protein